MEHKFHEITYHGRNCFFNLYTFLIMWFQLKPQEAEFLAVNTNAALSTFEKVSENIGMCMYYLTSIHPR